MSMCLVMAACANKPGLTSPTRMLVDTCACSLLQAVLLVLYERWTSWVGGLDAALQAALPFPQGADERKPQLARVHSQVVNRLKVQVRQSGPSTPVLTPFTLLSRWQGLTLKSQSPPLVSLLASPVTLTLTPPPSPGPVPLAGGRLAAQPSPRPPPAPPAAASGPAAPFPHLFPLAGLAPEGLGSQHGQVAQRLCPAAPR